MKSMHNHYKEMLLDLDKSYAGIEQDLHKKYKDFIEKYKAQMEKKCKSLKSAYEEEHKLREELRTWAEVNMIALQEKVKDLTEDKKKSLERLEAVMAGGGKEMDNLKKALESEYSGKIERAKSEKGKIEADLVATQKEAKSRSLDVARLALEVIIQRAEHIIEKGISKFDPKPHENNGKPVEEPKVIALVHMISEEHKASSQTQKIPEEHKVDKGPDPDVEKLKDQNRKYKKEIQELKVSLANRPVPVGPDPKLVQENDLLKQQLEAKTLKHKKAIAELEAERNSLKNEVKIFATNLSAPSSSDDEEKTALKTQLALLAAEMAVSRDRATALEGQSSQIAPLQQSLKEKEEEIAALHQKLAAKPQIQHVQPVQPVVAVDISGQLEAKDERIGRLNEEIANLKVKIEEITTVPVGIVAPNAKDDKEKKELKALLGKQKQRNEILKEEVEKLRRTLVDPEEVVRLKAHLEAANDKILGLQAAVESQAQAPVKVKKPKVQDPAPVVSHVEPKRQMTPAKDLLEDDNEEELIQLREKLALANQEVTFLKSQLQSSGKPAEAFPTEELAKLNHDLSEANRKIVHLNQELSNRPASRGNSEKLLAEIALLKSENTGLKANDKSGEISKLSAALKALQQELDNRPTDQDIAKLNDVIKSQEKQIKDSSSSQGQQLKNLNDQIASIKSAHEAESKDKDAKYEKLAKESADTVNKLNKQIADLEKIRENLEKALKDEKDSRSKVLAELDQVKKVAGEVMGLTKKVEELTATVVTLQEKNTAKEQELKDSLRQRKLLHNQLEDLKGKIRVFCRVRPLGRSELERGCVNITTVVDEFTITCDSKNGVKPFVYDSVFGPNNTQSEIFEDTRRSVQSAIDGYNVCIFAYGQTGSGKTYTMQGDSSNPGIIPRAMEEMFNILNGMPGHYRWEVSCYMVELYLDTLIDLFLGKDFKGTAPSLSIKKDIKGIVTVPEATLYKVKSSNEIMQKFDYGNTMRHTSSTKMNDTSSRSHLVFSVMIDVTNTETNQRTVGKLSLVDLAGSERVSKTEATAERLKEGRAINKSLSALGDVISALSSNESHIPYRNNKLTMLMSDSLGGTAKTLMFVNISPADYNQEETTMSLYYAARVKLITNDPTKNIESKEMSNIKSELLMITSERDKYKTALEKSGINIGNLDSILESRNEDFDDPKYDDL